MRVSRLCVLAVLLVFARPACASEATLLRLFLPDGATLVSFGEFARSADLVVFSMPVGGTDDQPRLQLVAIPQSRFDWPRTDRYAASARYQRYAATRGEADFDAVTTAAARVLNDIAASTQPGQALTRALQARAMLAAWPAAHYGFRRKEIDETLALLDDVIADLRVKAGVGAFDLALTAQVQDVPLEPVLGMPRPPEMLAGILRAADLVERRDERMALLQAALVLMQEARASWPKREVSRLSSSVLKEVRTEQAVDADYARAAGKALTRARVAAAEASVRDIESQLARLSKVDARLGHRRPETIESVRAALLQHLDAAQRLRLRRDQWTMRRGLYRAYQRAVGPPLLQLVRAQPALESIRRLDGPEPATLDKLANRLAGGAEVLQRQVTPGDLADVHARLVGAWRFAEQALASRRSAVSSASVPLARDASSAAAAALMMLADAQRGLASFVAPPVLP